MPMSGPNRVDMREDLGDQWKRYAASLYLKQGNVQVYQVLLLESGSGLITTKVKVCQFRDQGWRLIFFSHIGDQVSRVKVDSVDELNKRIEFLARDGTVHSSVVVLCSENLTIAKE